jgi:phenylacetate-coenzyme A ligase PaaK-like adenylate-forming protein
VSNDWDRRSIAEHDRLRDRALASWLPQVFAFAPYWTGIAERLGIEPRDARSWGDLLRVPPSLEQDLLGRSGAGTALVVRPTLADVEASVDGGLFDRMSRVFGGDDEEARQRTLLHEYRPVQALRAGRGDALALASSHVDLLRAEKVGARSAEILGLSDHDHVVSAVPSGPDSAHHSVRAMGLGAHLLMIHPRGHGRDLEDCVAVFDLLPVTAVVVTREEAESWAEVLRSADADVSRVERVIVVGLPPDEEARGRIEEAWHAAGARDGSLRVLAAWAPSVSRSLWVECDAGGTGLHVQPGADLLESGPPTVAPVATGAPDGDLVLTTLGWRGTALLRLRTGVASEPVRTDPCEACGRTLPRVPAGLVPDAWDVTLRDGGGATRVLDTRSLPLALEGASAWQVDLETVAGRDRFVVRAAHLGPTADRVADRVERRTGVRPDEVTLHDDPVEVGTMPEGETSSVRDLRG